MNSTIRWATGTVCLLIGFTSCVIAIALSASASAAEGVGHSEFRLFSSRCEIEGEAGPEATPQSPPLPVDDPGTPGCNHWEINVVVDDDLSHSENHLELPLLDINYGIGDNIQLKYEVPYLMNQSSGAGSLAGVGESKAGVKYSFFDDEARELEMGIYPQLTFVGAGTQAVADGLATPGTIVTLPLLLTHTLGQGPRGDVKLTANLGYNFSTKADVMDFVSASVGVGTPVSERIAVMVSLSTEQAVRAIDEDVREETLRADVGIIANLSRSVRLLGSIGHSLSASDDFEHTYALVGMRFNLNGSGPRPLESVAANAGNSPGESP